MDDNAKAFARNMLRLRIHEADGQAYQDLLVRVMNYASRGFRTIKASGQIGDRKNDGYDSGTGTYYQVYAPEDVSRYASNALAKLRTDFPGLMAFWNTLCPVRRFYYVINDKYNGVSPDLERELVTIKTSHGLEVAEPLLAKDLEATVFSLSNDQIVTIVGHVPNIDATEFLFLSGFTYFIGAWIAFERVGRRRAEPAAAARRPLVGRPLIAQLSSMSIVSSDERIWLDQLSTMRGRLVHGDTTDLPPKALVDQLVALTNRVECEVVAT